MKINFRILQKSHVTVTFGGFWLWQWFIGVSSRCNMV